MDCLLLNKIAVTRSVLAEEQHAMMNSCRLFLTLLLAFLFLDPSKASASPDTEQLTVILLMDNSGSMKVSDPEGLRYTGVRLFASLLDPGDSLGLIVFSTVSESPINHLLTLRSRDDASNILTDLNIPPAGGFTDIKAAFEGGMGLLDVAGDPGEKKVIVLLTDGKPEIQNPYPQYEQETLDLARSIHVPVMAIALSAAAQTPFLDHLAAATNGNVIPANDASDLLNAYLQILGQVKDRTVIGGEKFEMKASMMIEPALAPYISTVTFVTAKPPSAQIFLLGTDDREIAGTPSGDERYSIFTLEDPVGGEYSVRLQGQGEAQAWAILRSRLRMQVISPGTIHPLRRDLPIVVNLLEETSNGDFIKIIGDANFTASVTLPDGRITSLDRFFDDGTHGDAVSGDGNYTRLFPDPNQSGLYLIAIQGWKGVIPVRAETWVNVLKFPEFIVDAPAGKVDVRGGALVLRVHLDDQDFFEQGEVVAQITAPSGLVSEYALQRKDRGYEGQFIPGEDGKYHVLFAARGVQHLSVEYQTQVEHSFVVELIPTAKVQLDDAQLASACFSTSRKYSLWLSVIATDEDDLSFTAPGWQVTPDKVRIQPGGQVFSLQLYPLQEARENVEHLQVRIEGSDKLEIRPEPVIDVEFQNPGLYARCRAPINTGALIMLVAVIVLVSIHRTRKAALPPLVTGTLRHWQSGGSPALAAETDLTSFKKHALLIGSAAACDVLIPNTDLAPKHARLVAERSLDGIETYLEPLGEVRKGYSLQSFRFVLRHGETFLMGTHEFQYLSDRVD